MTAHHLSSRTAAWSAEALAMAAQAKGMSGRMLEQLATRIQRHTGRRRESCWRLIIQYGIKGRLDYRRWTETELDQVREELVKASVEEVAKKVKRTPEAIRNMLRRNHLSLRDIRCDLFAVESLAYALHVRKTEVIFWIEQNWLQATISERGKRKFYTITPEALRTCTSVTTAMQRGMRNLALFEAYVEYCFAPKHTLGEQLLEVRRDKRERAAFMAAGGEISNGEDDDEDDTEMDGLYRIETADSGPVQISKATMPETCSRCGVPISSSKMSIREIAVSVVCGCLLLSILIPAGLMAEHWMEETSHRFVDRMVWREPTGVPARPANVREKGARSRSRLP